MEVMDVTQPPVSRIYTDDYAEGGYYDQDVIPFNKVDADCDKNGEIDLRDVLLLRKYLIGQAYLIWQGNKRIIAEFKPVPLANDYTEEVI